MSNDKQKAVARRMGLLKRHCHGNIALNCEGGVPLDKDMRRLEADGLVRIIRPVMNAQPTGFGGGAIRRSIAKVTPLGFTLLVEHKRVESLVFPTVICCRCRHRGRKFECVKCKHRICGGCYEPEPILYRRNTRRRLPT